MPARPFSHHIQMITYNGPIIDSHQHFWRYDPQAYSWISSEMQVLQQDYLPPQFAQAMQPEGVGGSIAVQALPTVEDTDFLLALAAENPGIKGVVGWCDLQSPDLEAQLDRWQHQALLKGFRHIRQSEADPVFYQRPAVQQGLRVLQQRGYSFDILVYWAQLPDAVALADAFPNLPLVLDHLGKPDIKDPAGFGRWLPHFAELARRPNVLCKLSGLVTEANWHQWQANDFKPYIAAALEHFGPARLMYGSDWPVCLLAASAQQVLQLIHQPLNELTAHERQQIYAGSASRFYRIG